MNIVFLTRFSIFETNIKAWRINKHNDIGNYKKKLFDKDRLENRFNNFEKICLPSILQQTSHQWKWHIGISDQLPNTYKQKIASLCTDRRIHIYPVSGINHFVDLCDQSDTNYATVRLDDDDALNANFCNKLLDYKSYDKQVISFPFGSRVILDNNKICYGTEVFYPKIALGLSAINFNILRAGDHSSIDSRYKVVYNNTKDMYYVNCGQYSESQRKFL